MQEEKIMETGGGGKIGTGEQKRAEKRYNDKKKGPFFRAAAIS